jgi:hypothetical protein
MHIRLVTAVALAGLFACADRAPAQVVYYSTPLYYNSPFNPYVRTYSMPVMYSTYTSPVIIPTRFVDPPFGTVGYTYPPTAWGAAATAPAAAAAVGTAPASPVGSAAAAVETKTASGSAPRSATGAAGAGAVAQGGYIQPFPAFRQVGYSTYSPAPVPIGGVFYSGDAYIPPSSYRNTPYDYGPGMNFNQFAQTYNSYYYLPYNLSVANYGAYVSPYFQVQFGQGYGGWGWGRGWGGWGWSW